MPAYLRLALPIALLALSAAAGRLLVAAEPPPAPGPSAILPPPPARSSALDGASNQQEMADILQRALQVPGDPCPAPPHNVLAAPQQGHSSPSSLSSFVPRPAPSSREAIVAEVRIHGNRLTSTTAIHKRMKTRPGKEYDPGVLVDDVRRLYATWRFANVWADTVVDGPGRALVHIHVRELPNRVGSISFHGNRTLSSAELEQVTGLRPGRPLNPIANKVAGWKIIEHYREEGRPFARCDLIEGAEVADTRVVFRITEGRRSRVKAIRVTGQAALLSAMLRKSSSFSFKLLKADLAQRPPWLSGGDVRRLIELYRSSGFPQAWIDRDLFYSPDECEVTVVLRIVEGPEAPGRSPCTLTPDVGGKPLPLSPDLLRDSDGEDEGASDRDIRNVRSNEPGAAARALTWKDRAR
jgi:hypothetical protein